MNSIAGSRKSSRTALQRILAAFLLFLFVQDIGFHIAEAFLTPTEGLATTVLLGGHGNTDPDGCGIPGHENTPFHHHHYPAVVTQAPLRVPLVAIARLHEILPLETVHSSTIIPIGRAPPLA
jgi:hypothetical protein